jgi:hypothetical protein
MPFVIMNSVTQVRHSQLPVYITQSGARAALTRHRKGRLALGPEWCVMAYAEYQAQVPQIEVTNLMSGQPVTIPADTPWVCNPSSESYWSA